MNWIEALLLGLVQGLTEFLPVSSSGHLELGHAILDIHGHENLTFTVVVHGATVLSTIIVFRKDLYDLLAGSLQFRWNAPARYMVKILVSMIPVVVIGLFFREQVESLFTGDTRFVGFMLIITASFLFVAHFIRTRERELSYAMAFIIGIVQAIAVLPGISRSGSTISAGLILGAKKEEVTRFSFLMVLVPVIGANLVDLLSAPTTTSISPGIAAMIIGFLAAFLGGLFACRWMILLVKKGKLLYFGFYCLIVGIVSVLFL